MPKPIIIPKYTPKKGVSYRTLDTHQDLFGYRCYTDGRITRNNKNFSAVDTGDGLTVQLETNTNELKEFLVADLIFEAFNKRKPQYKLIFKDGNSNNFDPTNLVEDDFITQQESIVKKEEKIISSPVAKNSILNTDTDDIVFVKSTKVKKNEFPNESWLPIREFPCRDRPTDIYLGKYEVSNYGRLKTKGRSKPLPGNKKRDTYGQLTYRLEINNTNTALVTRAELAAYHFKELLVNNPKKEVLGMEYKDGDATNSFIDNLIIHTNDDE